MGMGWGWDADRMGMGRDGMGRVSICNSPHLCYLRYSLVRLTRQGRFLQFDRHCGMVGSGRSGLCGLELHDEVSYSRDEVSHPRVGCH